MRRPLGARLVARVARRSATRLRSAQRRLHRLEHVGIELAHQLADELHLAALRSELSEAFCLDDRVVQPLGQAELE